MLIPQNKMNTEIPFITTISLVWLIYTFLFSDADKQILDALNRLKFALSINPNNHHLDLALLQAHGFMGIPEIIYYGEGMPQLDAAAKNIKVFATRYNSIERFKSILMVNLFLLTAHVVFYDKFYNCFNYLQLHIILSLILGGVFYWWTAKKLSALIFSQVEF